MRIPSSGSMVRVRVAPQEADRWAERGKLIRRVFDLLADGRWHTGTEIANAYRGEYGEGWEWQSCISQLRKKLRAEGGDIDSEAIKGRHEFRYRLTLPRQAHLAPHLERSSRIIAERREQLRLGV